MSEPLRSPKLRPWHLDRIAVVYVRQSTPQQVLDHKESTARQYALADRAVTLGWPRDRVTTIDDEALDAMAGCEKVCKYIDLPLQHASNDVLRRMKRPGTTTKSGTCHPSC